MNSTKIIFFLFIIVLFTNCDNQQNFFIKKLNEAYKKFQSKIPERVLGNFPLTIEGDSTIGDILFPVVLKFNHNYCGVFITYNLSGLSFDSLYKKTVTNNSFVGLIGKKQIVRLKLVKNENYLSKYKQIFSQKNVYMIPDYEEKDCPVNDSLSNDIETLIINTEMGNFLPNEDLVDRNLLPNKYKHGYSKGIFIDKGKRRMIYWLIIW